MKETTREILYVARQCLPIIVLGILYFAIVGLFYLG